MNKADSERLESALVQMGLSSVSSPDDADVIFLNSCVVRQSAEDKVVGTLGSLKPLKVNNPGKIVALMGCMVGPKTDVLEQRFPYVDVFLRPQQYEPLINLIGERLGIDAEGCIGTLTASPNVTAYIPIIHGCDKFCTFCIIPYRRGREISRPIPEIVREAELLSHRGVKEVTLLGQNVDSYGHDLPGNPDLGDLLSEVNEITSIQRVRFLTSHPNDMSDHIIDKVAELEKVCENINLPFQAGDDQVLLDMRRGYTSDDYIRLVEKIRNRIPTVSMSTDLIVGFCGESDSQFEKTLDMLREIRFDKVHSAAYSTREGTIADRKMKDDVSDEDKRYRLRAVDELQEQIQTELNSSYVDVETQVLIEGMKRGRIYGRNRSDKLVYVDAPEDTIGSMVDVTIKETSPWSLNGSLS